MELIRVNKGSARSTSPISRKLLIIAMTSMTLVGLSFASVPFIASMSPNAKAINDSLHVYIKDMENGDYRIADAGWIKVYIIKDYDSVFRVFNMYTYNDNVVMPDYTWSRWGWLCENFGPELVGAKVKKNGVIKCHDSQYDENEWPQKEWHWDYKGQNLGGYTEDLPQLTHRFSPGYVAFPSLKQK